MKKMKIRISKEGKTTIQVEGASGPECVEFTKLVEHAVGSVEQRTHTEDYEKEVREGIDLDVSESERL